MNCKATNEHVTRIFRPDQRRWNFLFFTRRREVQQTRKSNVLAKKRLSPPSTLQLHRNHHLPSSISDKVNKQAAHLQEKQDGAADPASPRDCKAVRTAHETPGFFACDATRSSRSSSAFTLSRRIILLAERGRSSSVLLRLTLFAEHGRQPGPFWDAFAR